MINPKISIILVYSNQGNRIKETISKLLNQSFNSFEIICVNSNTDDETVNNVCEIANNDERIKLINLPNNTNNDYAKQAALDIASGEMVCFLNADDEISLDLIQKLYYEKLNSDRERRIYKDCKLYNRNFLEKSVELEEIIQSKVNIEVQKIVEILKNNELNTQEKLNNFYKNSENTINNKVYDLSVRFNSLEKSLYDKENEIKENTKTSIQDALNNIYFNNNKIYEDITKVYDFVHGEINQKGNEINKVYEEITNNYHYTEKLVDEVKQNLYYEKDKLYQKIDELSKEQEIRYNNLQKLIDFVNDELKNKIESLGLIPDSNLDEVSNKLADIINLEKNVNQNFDKIYAVINENNSKFYEELSKLYKEINEKINWK